MKFILARLYGLTSRSPPPVQSPALAVAQLLIEIARSDLKVQDKELAVVRQHLAQGYDLSSGQLDALVAAASQAVDAATSLYDTVKRVNETLDAQQKAGLMHALWQVAYADEKLDAYEEALLRRMADLIHVPHEVFIREKLRLLERG
ncbi:MAG: TerB family tellurite resistance protein [Stagnimonas sp.]|nr:TerB family tellurite resistance protein [Stagnimonas sp.]